MAIRRVRTVARSTVPPTVDWRGIDTRRVEHEGGSGIFAQGDAANSVMYIERGSVRLSVVSPAGKEAVVAVLGPRTFFGEGCLAGQSARMATATAMTACTTLVVDKHEMVRQLHERPAFSDRFLVHMLARNIRVEEDLVDQLFNSSEKRLARTLLLLARYGEAQPALAERFLAHMLARNIRVEEDLVDQLFNSSEKRLARVLLLLARYGKADRPLPIPKMSQETLAEIVGTTRSRINFFMNKFRDLGLIEYNGDIKVNNALITVILHD